MRTTIKTWHGLLSWGALFATVILLLGCNEVTVDEPSVEEPPVVVSGEPESTPVTTAVILKSGTLSEFEFGGDLENISSSDIELILPPKVLNLTLLDDAKFSISSPDNFIGSDVFEYQLKDSDNDFPVRIQITVYSDQPDSLERKAPQFLLPNLGLYPREMAVIVNSSDDDSLALAQQYMAAREIPDENLFLLELGKKGTISQADFSEQTDGLLAALPNRIKAFSLLFSMPYRVKCMSITTAFAMGGFDEKYCNLSGRTCGSTAYSDYFNSALLPAEDLIIRPAMLVRSNSIDSSEALFARGVAADHSFPTEGAYFVRTTDAARSVRWPYLQKTVNEWNESGAIISHYIDAVSGGASNTLKGVDNVLFYLTGLTRVNDLNTLVFQNGAIADHLTSYGGLLDSIGGQMNALEWIEAGATASYGTVVEPCNYTQKFPRSDILLDRYYRGNTALEAYWKSVAWPGEGVFVGEPLARPWGRKSLRFEDGVLTLQTTELEPKRQYVVTASDDLEAEFETVLEVKIETWGLTNIVIENADKRYYRLQ